MTWIDTVLSLRGTETISNSERYDQILDLNMAMIQLWPKYMQLCLYEYGLKYGVAPLELDETEMASLAKSQTRLLPMMIINAIARFLCFAG